MSQPPFLQELAELSLIESQPSQPLSDVTQADESTLSSPSLRRSGRKRKSTARLEESLSQEGEDCFGEEEPEAAELNWKPTRTVRSSRPSTGVAVPTVDTAQMGPGSTHAVAEATDALIVRRPWVNLLAAGLKTWELRGSATYKRGRVGLIEGGTGTIVAGATLVGCHGPLTRAQLAENESKHCVSAETLSGRGYKSTYAWEFKDATPLAEPVAYQHPSGAIIWVKLQDPVMC